GVDPARVLGAGVAVSGVVEQTADAVIDAQTLGWEAVPLGAMLRAGTMLPVHVDNGAKTLGQAEMWFGAGGASYRGARSSAGEWGHTTISYGGRLCRCGARGCLEAYVGAEGILARFDQAGGTGLDGADEETAIGALLDQS